MESSWIIQKAKTQKEDPKLVFRQHSTTARALEPYETQPADHSIKYIRGIGCSVLLIMKVYFEQIEEYTLNHEPPGVGPDFMLKRSLA
jgi:hypothetical protein